MLRAGWNVETRLIASLIGKVIRLKEEAVILVEVIWGCRGAINRAYAMTT